LPQKNKTKQKKHWCWVNYKCIFHS
jgi:hypothetical protein